MDIRPLTTLETPTEPPNCIEVQAARFSGGGITIVELTPTGTLPAATVRAATSGLRRTRTQVVGWATPRDTCTLPILGWARGMVHTRPHLVKTRMVKVINQLAATRPRRAISVVRELARYYMEAGRSDFLPAYLDQILWIARHHNLLLDPERRLAMLREFAAWNALSIDHVRAEAATAAQHFTPEQAFDHHVRLIALASRSGITMQPDLVGQARQLGATAGLDTDRVDAAVVTAVFDTTGFRAAPDTFFAMVGRSLRALVHSCRDYQEKLLDVRPEFMTLDRYHDLLDGTEAWDELAKNKWEFATWLKDLIFDIIVDHPIPFPPRKWLIDAIHQVRRAWGCLDVLGKKLRYCPLDVINTLVAIGGVDRYDVSGDAWMWECWFDSKNYEDMGVERSDLSALVKNTHHYIHILERHLDVADIEDNLPVIREHEAAREIAERVLRSTPIAPFVHTFARCFTQALSVSVGSAELWKYHTNVRDTVQVYDLFAAYISPHGYGSCDLEDPISSLDEARYDFGDNFPYDFGFFKPEITEAMSDLDDIDRWATKTSTYLRNLDNPFTVLTEPAAAYLYELSGYHPDLNLTAADIAAQFTQLADELAHPQQSGPPPRVPITNNLWVQAIGCDARIRQLLQRPFVNPQLAETVCEFLAAGVLAGIYASGWLHHTVAYHVELSPGWHHGAWVVESHREGKHVMIDMLIHPDHTNLQVFGITFTQDLASSDYEPEDFYSWLDMTYEDVIRRLGEIPMNLAKRWKQQSIFPGNIPIETIAALLVDVTTLTPAAIYYVLLGITPTHPQGMPRRLRIIAEDQLTSDIIMGLLRAYNSPDMMAGCWAKNYGTPQLHLSDDEYAQLMPLCSRIKVGDTLTDRLPDTPNKAAEYRVLLRHMARMFSPDDPRQGVVADKLRVLDHLEKSDNPM